MKKKSFCIALYILIFDRLIKNVINTYEVSWVNDIVPNVLYLTKVYNDGAAWSIFSGSRCFLIIFAIIAFVFLWKYQAKIKYNFRNILSFGLVYGGVLGNLYDRLRYGYVIDYIGVIIFDYDFPVFNLADMAIVIGLLLFIYAIYKGEDLNGSKGK